MLIVSVSFNYYIFKHAFQWTSSECYNNVTITVKICIVMFELRRNGITDERFFLTLRRKS